MYREKDARRYAELAVKQGIHVQKGQTVILRVGVECAEFGRMLVEAAYKAGAGDVQVIYNDQLADRIRYELAPEETLGSPPAWSINAQTEYLERGACLLSVSSADPDGFAGLDMAKVGAAMNAQKIVAKPFRAEIDKGKNQWTIIGVPSEGWAKKTFPGEDPQRGMEKLWDAIYHTMRLDLPDPVAAWEEHTKFIRSRCKKLSESGVVTLKLKSGLGTDLTLGLLDNAIWEGGSSKTPDGVEFHANMPTEEVFTSPNCWRTDGKVVSSMPLNYQGSLIEGMSFTFKDGVVAAYSAEKNEDALRLMLAADEGCKRLGEVALVPYGSLIQETGILFYNTLYDENASCHLALGSSFPSCVKGGLEMTPEEREKIGLNQSVSHVDFMFGTADLSVVGVRADGSSLEIFRDGQWAF